MLYKSLKTKSKILLFLSIGVLAFMIALLGNIFIENKIALKNKEKIYKEHVTKAYQNILNESNVYFQTRLKEFLIKEGVIDAIKNSDREKLYKLVLPKWNLLREENKNITVLHFHKPNGLTFLRVHNPKKYNDDIAKKRAMCSFMHEYKTSIMAYEAGINLLGYRVMIPIFDNTTYLGAIEIGIEPNFILDKLKKTYNVTGSIFTKKENIFKNNPNSNNSFTIEDYQLQSDSLKDQKILYNLPKNYQLNTDTRAVFDDKIYEVFLINHKDFKGEISNKTLIFYDVTKINEDFKSTVINIIFFSIIFYLFLIFIVKFGFEKLLDKVDTTNKSLQKSNKSLQKNLAFLKSHQLAMDESSIVTKSDLQGKVTYVNDNFCKVTGYTKSEIIGKPHNIIRHPDNPKKIFEEMWDTIKAKNVWKGTLKNKGKQDDYWVDITILPILDDNNNITEYMAVRHDITEQIKQQEILDNIANTDSLTGYGNRYKLIQDINNSTQPALVIINIDSFSQINDFYGHEKGDVVIKKLGAIISKTIEKDNCELYHLQGDEYVIFNKEISKENFIQKIKKIIQFIKESKLDIDGKELHLDFSAAISFENKINILTTANMALKVAKRESEELIIYSENISLNNEYENNIKWTEKIKKAINEDLFIPVFQPIVNNTNNEWEKYECLVRMKDEDKLISPYFFLDIAKKTKQYTSITKRMIRKSFDFFKDKNVEFSINLTIEDILNADIQTYIFEMLDEYKMGSKVVFEIVESESINNFEKIYEFIQKVKAANCKIAIDDFGTGYSNFEYLVKLQADYIKIDGSLIKDITTNHISQIVVKNIVNFAKDLNMKTIAEFVENEEILNKIKELGIDYSQGYYFSEPKVELS